MDDWDYRHWLQLAVSFVELMGIFLVAVRQKRAGMMILAIVGVEYFCAARWIYLREWTDPIFVVYVLAIAMWLFGYTFWDTIKSIRWLEENSPGRETLSRWVVQDSVSE